MGKEFWAARWHVVCQAKKIETYERSRDQGYLKSTKKMNLSHISPQRAIFWRKAYTAFFCRSIMPSYMEVGGGLGVLQWIRHEPFHIAAIALMRFQYQLMEFHTTDRDSCWWKAHPNYAGRNSISVTCRSAKYYFFNL